jgi:hypothetical protein
MAPRHPQVLAGVRLAFVDQPGNVAASAPIAPSIRVAVLDADGVVVPFAADTVTLSLEGAPPGASLRGVTRAVVRQGIATFSGISVDSAATRYRLRASAPGKADALSATFLVIGRPAQLRFWIQPGYAHPGSPVSPAVQVQVLDAQKSVIP